MAPLVLEGDTLGQRQKQYNKIVSEATKNDKYTLAKLNYDDQDVDNLLKIDVASYNRNVEYILDVLRCEDMLYVSRAIKLCKWLITEEQYSHIINPEYLHTELFPQMTCTASNKLILHIRLNLKNENRVEHFFNYYKEKNIKIALKWLPNCSVNFIENIVKDHARDIDRPLLKRLCEKSISILQIFTKKYKGYDLQHKLEYVQFLLNVDIEKYLDIIEELESHRIPSFGKKHTKLLMKRCSDRIINNFEKYANSIDIQTFAKLLKREEIKDFLVKQAQNTKLDSWFNFDKIKHFVKYIPKEGRFQFLKDVFIDKIDTDQKAIPLIEARRGGGGVVLCSALQCTYKDSSTNASVYRWYKYAPFDEAFKALKSFIRVESNPEERTAILILLIDCASRNSQNLQSLLQYYHKKHINEPFKFKIQFVNSLISRSNVNEYNEHTWKMINELFYSMEIYSESGNNVQSCIQAIITYKVLHNQEIPEVIQNKLFFDSFKAIQKKLNKGEKEKLFSYLYEINLKKIQNKAVASETDLDEVVRLLEQLMKLLTDWEKDITEYPIILAKFKEYVKLRKQNSWNTNLLPLYNVKKQWKRHMFNESLTLNPTLETCLNILKHNAEMLKPQNSEVEAVIKNNNLSLRCLLNKLRTYWSQSLAKEWAKVYTNNLGNLYSQKALVRGLCILLPREQLTSLIKQHVPKEEKINWSEADEFKLGLCKYIARYMYLGRPSPSPDLVLSYAKGDYLQYAISSVNSILYNLSSNNSQQYIPKLLYTPVSIQKHGIRLAFIKFNETQIKDFFYKTWNTNKNSSIRAVLFNEIYSLLCRETKQDAIDKMWELLNYLIDNLTADENRKIYTLLGKVNKLPISIKAKYCMKSYNFLISLPPKANCKDICTNIRCFMYEYMEFLDSDFVEGILLDLLDSEVSGNCNEFKNIISSYLLCTKSKETQIERYEKVFIPTLERYLAKWDDVDEEGRFKTKSLFDELFYNLCRGIQSYTLEKKYFMPLNLFTKMLEKLEKSLPVQKNYVLLRSLKLFVAFIDLLNQYLITRESTNDDDISYLGEDWLYCKWTKYFNDIAPAFANIIVKFLKEEIEAYGPSIYNLFGSALSNIMDNIGMELVTKLEILYHVLDENVVESYFLVLYRMDIHVYGKEKAKRDEILKKMFTHPSDEFKMHYYCMIRNI